MAIRTSGDRAGSRLLKGLALVALVLSGGSAAAGLSPQQQAIFGSYLTSPAYKAILEKGYNDAEPAMLKAQCPALKITAFDPPEIVQQPLIAKGAGGGWQVTDGAWVQRATLDRCGKPAARRTMVSTGANNMLHLHALLPGDYGGGYRLESTALGTVVTTIVYTLECKDKTMPVVLDVQRLRDARKPSWAETWTVFLCGKTATARVVYVPNGAQTAILMSEVAYSK
ncbi:MAG TPA: hypothetical protein VHZ78_06015 [Rhizomicrobium sp.]|jgi:hypothetical protein|nr:hypothetical protein [Rhizomicrobium sp.]